jgi:hypothetical protein
MVEGTLVCFTVTFSMFSRIFVFLWRLRLTLLKNIWFNYEEQFSNYLYVNSIGCFSPQQIVGFGWESHWNFGNYCRVFLHNAAELWREFKFLLFKDSLMLFVTLQNLFRETRKLFIAAGISTFILFPRQCLSPKFENPRVCWIKFVEIFSVVSEINFGYCSGHSSISSLNFRQSFHLLQDRTFQRGC